MTKNIETGLIFCLCAFLYRNVRSLEALLELIKGGYRWKRKTTENAILEHIWQFVQIAELQCHHDTSELEKSQYFRMPRPDHCPWSLYSVIKECWSYQVILGFVLWQWYNSDTYVQEFISWFVWTLLKIEKFSARSATKVADPGGNPEKSLQSGGTSIFFLIVKFEWKYAMECIIYSVNLLIMIIVRRRLEPT